MMIPNFLKKIRLSEDAPSLFDRFLTKDIRDNKLTYLSKRKLHSLAVQCHLKESNGIPGVFIEAGCALGGSAILIASLKYPERSFLIYDVFEMIPPPTDADTDDVHVRYSVIADGSARGIGGDKYYGYMDNLYELVIRNLRKFGIDPNSSRVSLIKGKVQDTMSIDEPVALAHIDVDWYEPVMTCLNQIFPRLSVGGGTIILDDYHSWGGCRKATDEYLVQVDGQFRAEECHGALKITRTKLASDT